MTRPDMVVPASAGATPPFGGFDLTPGGCIVLYPTKTRLRLLAAVEVGDVIEGTTEDHMTGALIPHTFLIDPPDPARKVCARIRELEAAGWVEYLDDQPPAWRLTDAGRATLKAARDA